MLAKFGLVLACHSSRSRAHSIMEFIKMKNSIHFHVISKNGIKVYLVGVDAHGIRKYFVRIRRLALAKC
jgi:hypothetical protein